MTYFSLIFGAQHELGNIGDQKKSECFRAQREKILIVPVGTGVFIQGVIKLLYVLFSVLFAERRKQAVHYEETENLKILRVEFQLSIQMKLRKSHKLSKQITTYLATES